MSPRFLLAGLAIEAIFLVAVVGPFSLLAHGTDLTDLGKLTDYQPLAAALVTLGLLVLFALYGFALLDVHSSDTESGRSVSFGHSERPLPNASTVQLALPAKFRTPGVEASAGSSGWTGRLKPRLRESGAILARLLPWASRHLSLSLVAVGFSALFSLTLVLLYPVTAIDVFNYAVEGHAAVFHHLNPMATAPSQVTGDTFIDYAGIWADSTSPYGPLWLILTYLDAFIAGTNIVLAIALLKALGAVAVVATTFLLAWAFRHRGPRESALAAMLFGWNPLVLLELVGNGHNDAVLTLLLVAALVLVAKDRPVLGALGVGGSVLIKFSTLGAIPLFLFARLLEHSHSIRTRLLRVATSAGIMLAVAVAAYAPFWTGPVILQRAQAVDSNYLSSIPALIILLIPGAINWLAVPRFVLLAGVGLWQVNSLRLGRANLAQATFEVLFMTILVASHFAGWYLALLVAVATLAGDRWAQARMAVFTFTATLTTPIWAYLWWWTQDWMSMTTIHLIVVPLTFAPPLAIAFLALRRSARGMTGRQEHPFGYLTAIYVEMRNRYLTARNAVGSSS